MRDCAVLLGTEEMRHLKGRQEGGAEGATCPRTSGFKGPHKVRHFPVFGPLRSQEALFRSFVPGPLHPPGVEALQGLFGGQF